MPALSSYVRIRCISYWMQNICLLLSYIFHVLPAYIQAWKGTDRIRYPVSLFFIWIDSYFYCPVYLSHPDSLYTDGLFQQVLYFKDFFCSLLHLIVQHLSAIFHNQNQTKTLNENYYLNSLCTLTYCLFRPSKFQEHIVLFSIIIYLLCQNKCFVIFYKFEQTCSNVQFIPSPIKVREFLLRLLKSIKIKLIPGNNE